MATRTAKLRIELDGEKKYKEAIAEINRESKTLGAEMKKLAAEYKGNESSVEALTKKQTLLDRALLESKAKVEETRKQLDSWRAALERVRQEQGASSDEYKQAQKKVQEYEAALANAETQEINLEHAIRENNEALQDADKELDETAQDSRTLGDQISDLAGKFGIKLPEGLKKSLDGMSAFSAGSVAALGAVATAVTVAYKAYKKLFDLTLEQSKAADELLTKSQIYGVDTETLQQWEYAASFVDVSADTITGALSKISKAAADGKDAFGKLGVAVTDSTGQLRDSEEILFDVLQALSEIGNETERDALAQELLGKSAQELNPLLLNLDEAQRRYNEALETGLVLSEQEVKKLASVDDAVEKNRLMWEGLEKQIAVQFADGAKEALELFGKLMDKAGKALVDSKLIENLGTVLQGIVGIADSVSAFTDMIPSWMNPIKNLSNEFYALGLVLAGVADALQLVVGLMPQNWGSGMVTGALGLGYSSGNASHIQRAKMAHNGTLDMYDSFYSGRNAIGSSNWRGGLTWVGESGPELVSLPQGSRIYNNQESRAIAQPTYVGADLTQVELLLADVLSALRDKRVIGRMA